MKIWKSLSEVPQGTKSVMTIGNFDGVHLGHMRVIQACVDRAKRRNAQAIALTFDPHPAQVHKRNGNFELISPLNDRLDVMGAAGLDAIFVAHYDRDLYTMSAQAFVGTYVCGALGACEIVVGEDFCFGADNEGNVETLRAIGRNTGFDVVMVADIVGPEGRRWSSSWVRDLLRRGDVEGASQVLGHLHRISGVVEHGFQRGRLLGFPTANLASTIEGLVPGDGVYAGLLVRQVPGTTAKEFLPSAISVGTNPQFKATKRTVETHVLGRSDLNLYDEQISITFVKRIRPMMSFNSVEDLQKQMDNDIRQAAAALGVGVTCRVDPAFVTAQ